MTTALKRPPPPTPSAIFRVATDYGDVQRRLAALSRIAGRLPRLTTEVELLTEVVDALLSYFDNARLVEVFVANSDWQESRLYCRERGGDLRVTQCGGVDALPQDSRGDFSVPRIIASDGTRGAMMSAPVLEGLALLGLLVVEAESGGRDFGEGEHDALAGVAAQVSMAIQQLRKRGQEQRSRMIERDLEQARRIQRSFLPPVERLVNGFVVATEYRPAYDVGGDFYDVISTGPGQLVAVIGDVAGKGVAGALMMSRVSSEIRRLVVENTISPSEVLTRINESFAALGVDDRFVTAACVKIDKNAGRLTVCNAGHVLPLVRRASGTVMPLGRTSGPPVGMLADQRYQDEVFPVDPGDVILLMTDGVVDPLHDERDQLGLWPVIELLSSAPRELDVINRQIVALVEERTGGRLPDDLTLLAVEVGPE